MKIYELIKRLEHIRDKMESTFSNEFQRGEIDNLIEELIKTSPEVGSQMPSQPLQTHWMPGTNLNPFISLTGTRTAGTGAIQGNISDT